MAAAWQSYGYVIPCCKLSTLVIIAMDRERIASRAKVYQYLRIDLVDLEVCVRSTRLTTTMRVIIFAMGVKYSGGEPRQC